MYTKLWSNLPKELLSRAFLRLPISRIYNLRVLSHEWKKEVDNKESELNRLRAEVPYPTKIGHIAQGRENSWFSLYDFENEEKKTNPYRNPLELLWAGI